MPVLHSLSIRRRGTTASDKSPAPSTTIKHIFTRVNTRRATTDTTTHTAIGTMGNAPSDMNGNAGASAATTSAKLRAVSALNRASTASDAARAMPGAEPHTPQPEPAPAKEEAARSPEPDTIEVKGYDTQAVPHVLNPEPEPEKVVEGPVGDVDVGEFRDVESGIPPVGSFEVEEPEQMEEPQQLGDAPEESGAPVKAEEGEAQAATEPDPEAPRSRAHEEEPEEPESPAPVSRDIAEPPPVFVHLPEPSETTAVSRTPTPPVPAAPKGWTPGTYVLLNARTGAALDLSGADNATVIGYALHGGPNQQWEFTPFGRGYLVRCVRGANGHRLYLALEPGRAPSPGAGVVASEYPAAWNVEECEDGIR